MYESLRMRLIRGLKNHAPMSMTLFNAAMMNIGGRLRRLEKPLEVLHLAELLERR